MALGRLYQQCGTERPAITAYKEVLRVSWLYQLRLGHVNAQGWRVSLRVRLLQHKFGDHVIIAVSICVLRHTPASQVMYR